MAYLTVKKQLTPKQLPKWIALTFYGFKLFEQKGYLIKDVNISEITGEIWHLSKEQVIQILCIWEKRDQELVKATRIGMDLDSNSDICREPKPKRFKSGGYDIEMNGNEVDEDVPMLAALTITKTRQMNVKNVTQILANHFRVNRIGQMNKNELIQAIKDDNIEMNADQLEKILKHLHDTNKVFYIDPFVHQL
eukprot:353828_1